MDCLCNTACFHPRHLKHIRMSIRCQEVTLVNLPPMMDKSIPIHENNTDSGINDLSNVYFIPDTLKRPSLV